MVSMIGVKPAEVATVEVAVLVEETVVKRVSITGAGVRVTVAVSYSVEVVEKVSVIVSAVEMSVVVS
jgi:hypothetical protein